MSAVEDAFFAGETTELHQERLLQLVRNAVSVGEWELAKASARVYHESKVGKDDVLHKLLLDIVHHPRKYSHGSKSVPTPFHLSWLALLLYVELYNNEKKEAYLSNANRRLLEFKIFLLTLGQDITPEQQQDVYCFFKLGHDEHKQHEALISLSKEFCQFLTEFAISNPEKCRTLTNFLVSPARPEAMLERRKDVIAECYLRVILSYIGRLKLFDESIQTMLIRDCIPVIVSAKEYFTPDNMLFINAVVSIVKIINEFSPKDMKLLYFSIVDCESKPFLVLALESSWKYKLNSLKLQDILEDTRYNEDEQRICIANLLSGSFGKNPAIDFMTAYQICDYYKIHFLDYIIHASLELINRGKYEFALEILKPAALQPLTPLIILLAWENQPSYTEKQRLIKLLTYQKGCEMDPTFIGACKRLEYNLNVSRKFFTKRSGGDSVDILTRGLLEEDVFREMDFSPVLPSINELKIFQWFSTEELVDLLNFQPTYPKCFGSSSNDERTIPLAEIRTYLCFCILQKTLSLFINGCGDQSGSKDDKEINNLKTQIQKISPLSFRLETLENLFSLLFIREEHLSCTNLQNSYDLTRSSGPSNMSELDRVSEDSVKIQKYHRFLFKEEAIKEYLDLLNECTMELIAAKYSALEKSSQDCYMGTAFDQRVSHLRQSINDASWRLQLVSDLCSFPQEENDSALPAAKADQPSVDTDSEGEYDEVPCIGNSGESEQLVARMLSSSESLVHLCLQKDSLLRGKQVIKMFQLEGDSCGLEVSFSESFDNVIKDLQLLSPVESTKPGSSSQLTHIRSAAAAGLLSSNIRSILKKLLEHDFITSSKTPFGSVALCFDLVVSGELPSAVCKTILDATDEFIKLDPSPELRSSLLSCLGVLKTSLSLFTQLETRTMKNVLNDTSSSFSQFLTQPYHQQFEGETESNFSKLAEQKGCLESIVQFLDDEIIATAILAEEKNTEGNLCRQSMNETLSAFSSDNLVLIPEGMPRRNYIKTLFRHVDTLARLQLYFKTRHTGKQRFVKFEQQSSLGGIKAANPFVVLKDDICDIFGRLLFEWSMPPKRLESIARQVNISLVKVVAKSFGLAIPVKSAQNCPDLTTFLLRQPINVLNKSNEEMEAKNPTEVMENLLEQLVKILSGMVLIRPVPLTGVGEICVIFKAGHGGGLPSTYETHVGSKQIKKVVESENFKRFVHTSSLLKFVDLNNLDTDNEKICFIINLHNVMFFHGILMILSGSIEGLPDISSSEVEKWSFESVMSNPVGRLAIDQFMAYEVGQVGIMSAFNIFRHILGITTAGYYGVFEWTESRLAFTPTNHDKRCIFLLTHGSSSCPPLKVLKPRTIAGQIESAAKNYLEKNVKVVQKNNRVIVPKLLHWHRDLFLQRLPLNPGLQTASSLDCKSRNILLLKFIMQNSSKLNEKLGYISKADFLFDVDSSNWNLNFNLDTEPANACNKDSTRNSMKEVTGQIKKSVVLNEPMKKYLYEASPVSASVICMALEKKRLLDQIGEVIIESKYGGIRMGTQKIFSLPSFIQREIQNIQQTVDASLPFQAFVQIRSELVLKILKCLQVDHPNVSAKYVKHVQSLIKVTVSLLDVCGSVNMESTEFLVELVHVFLSFGGMFFAALMETFPRMFPVVTKDRLLCESIYETRNRLDDLTETCMASGDNALEIDLDHIVELKLEHKRCLMLLNDPFLRYKMTMDSILYYDVVEALEILEVCSEGCSSSQTLADQLTFEAEKIRWYDRVQKLSMSHYENVQSAAPEDFKLTRWQDVIDFVLYHPEYVSILLVAAGAFDLIDFWINNFCVSRDLSKMCLRGKLYDLLKDSKTDYTRLHQHLEGLHNKHMTLELCQDLLQSSEISTHNSLALLRYMIEYLTDMFSKEKLTELLYTELGFKALDRLPESLKFSYWHLSSKPTLILEQLLMNMKVELAKTVIDVFRSNISESGTFTSLNSKIDDIVATYAEKSLAVPVLEMSVQHSLKDIERGQLSRKKRPRANSGQKNEANLEAGHDKQEEERNKQKLSTDIKDKEDLSGIEEPPVDRNHWISDPTAAQYLVIQPRCACASSVINNFTLQSKESSSLPESASSLPRYSSPINSDSEKDVGNKIESGDPGEWQLTVDDKKNEDIKKSFFFEQAPSASLCVAIVGQYSDEQVVGGMLLKFCNDLSKHMTIKDLDMDKPMLVGMIEFLLFNAKVKFMKAGAINGVELCDSYMAHVEVLKLLLNSDWTEIPTMQELSHPEGIRRLRDRLVDSERFSLAIDVTGKCGLDPGTVWFAWGLSQLKSGELGDARENFSKCLTPLKSVEERSLQPNVLYLKQILEIIETSPLLAYAKDDDLLTPLHAFIEQERRSQTGCVLDKRRYDEIIYYLTKYGSHKQFVRFYVRHGLMRKAAAYIRDRKCSDDIFVEELLMRNFQDGSFELLTRELEEMDPTLNSWKDYLVKSCRYLSRKRLFNCLYQMQIFLKDFFRAATTCVRFFLGDAGNPARSFKELYNRLDYLDRAKRHLETALKEKAIVKSTFVSHIGSLRTDDPESSSLIQEVPVSELKSHLNTIDLQIKVLNFFKERERVFNENIPGTVPTLFGRGQERAEVVSKLLVESINNAFPLASRIMQDYRLPAKVVIGDCIKKLALEKEYDAIFNLIKMTESTGTISYKGKDQLLVQVVEQISSSGENARQANQFIKMIKSQSKKVDALILCERLRDAYVEALKEDSMQDIERIRIQAVKLRQNHEGLSVGGKLALIKVTLVPQEFR
eukprot:gene14543-5610_t